MHIRLVLEEEIQDILRRMLDLRRSFRQAALVTDI